MPALAGCVDPTAIAGVFSGVPPPGFTPAVDSSLPFSGDTFPPTTTTNPTEPLQWSPSLSSALYRLDKWGPPYFSVNPSGDVTVRPFGDSTQPHQEIDLFKVVKKVSDQKSLGGLGLQLPLVIRFPDVLKHRLESLNSAFDFAVRTRGYGSHYQGVYPVKCNQDRFIVDDIVKFGYPFRFGLEAGSKPEILLAMSSLCNGHPDALLVCNGFKDGEYIALALIAQKLGINSVIVIEQEEEVDLVIELSRRLCARPVIGVRAKLRTKHSGHFGSTSGEKGKFGLTTIQILRVVRKLESVGMLECLQLMHFHIGSQIPSTTLLADGVSEGAQVYCELVRLGASMQVIDVGGGLGIDYDGSKSSESDISVGYTMEEYAFAVVGAIQSVCDRKGVKHPIVCSESGRALVSHHSILIFEAVSMTGLNATPDVSSLSLDHLVEGLSEEAQGDYKNLFSAAVRNEYEMCLVYADQLKQRCVDQFKEGSLGIEQLAAVDGLYELVSKALGMADPVSTYHVNLSIFTSIPDIWGIGQLFPIIPIHRLDQRPGVRGILSDLTCDSDGIIAKFIGGELSLALHGIGERGAGGGGGYYLGMFLGGAYEEALGGLHNLFGGPSVVRVSQSDGPYSFAVTRAVSGPSCGDVLGVMQHEPELMFQTLKHRAEEWLKGEDDNAVACLANGLATSFGKMPYLVAAHAASSIPCGLISSNHGYTYYYNSDDGVNGGRAGSENDLSEDEPWEFVCA